jgi:hypothetical protein
MRISNPAPRLTGSLFSYLSDATTIPSAASRACRNSREADPSPQTTIDPAPFSRASMHLRIKAGTTWLVLGSKLSFGP